MAFLAVTNLVVAPAAPSKATPGLNREADFTGIYEAKVALIKSGNSRK